MLYMDNARKMFSEACSSFNCENIEAEFYHNFAQMIPDRIDVDTLILALQIALTESEEVGYNILGFIALVPQYVRQCASVEFAHEFREKYNRNILGLSQDKLPDVDYGYIEVAEDVIDISNKDKYEVFAALYNASIPVGMGFMKYNPMPWSRETARRYFEINGKENSNDGEINFNWVMGRLVPCTFKDNLLYVRSYNYNTEDKMAQRIISTVPNIEDKKSNIILR